MREIKFRAWNKVYKEMEYDVTNVSRKRIIGESACESFHDVLTSWEYEVMQYTSLKDKNGKEIYEGDIIETVDTNNNICRSIVEFHQGVFCVGAWSEHPPKSIEHYNYDGDWSEQEMEIEDDEILYIVLQHSLDFKVVGNIYENPELYEIEG